MTTATEAEKPTKSKGKKAVVPAKSEYLKPADANIFAQRVEKKAYELYQKRGCQNGHDCDDWFEAQKLVEAEMITGK